MSRVFFFLYIYIYIYTYVRGLVTPTGQGFPSPLFLGVAIGLELRIRLWHMFWLAFVAVEVFAYVSLRKLFSPFRLFFHCADVLSWMTSSQVMHPGSFLLSLFLQKKGGMEVGGLGMPLCCFPRVFLSSRSTWSSGRGGGASGRAFGARELASVSSVHSWTGDPGVACLRRTPATFSVPVGSPSSSLHDRRGDRAGESSGSFFSVLGCLSRLVSTRSARWWGGWGFRVPLQLGFLPGLPIFDLGGREGT